MKLSSNSLISIYMHGFSKKKGSDSIIKGSHPNNVFHFEFFILENFKNFEVKSYFWLTPVWHSRRLLLPSVPHLEKVAG